MAELSAMSFRRLAALVVVVCWICSARAHAAADVSIEAAVTPAKSQAPGSVARITLTVRNHGPDPAPGSGVVSSDYPFLTGGYFDLVTSSPDACPVYYDDFVGPPGEPSFLVAIVLMGDLPAGAARTCTLALFVYPESRGPYQLSFRALSGAPDPNASNDLATLDLLFAARAPKPIPALAWFNGVFLGALLLAIGTATRWRNK